MPYKLPEVLKGDPLWTVDIIIASWMVLMGQRDKHWIDYWRDWPGFLSTRKN